MEPLAPLAQAAEDMAHLRATVARLEREVSELRETVSRFETPPLLTPEAFADRYGRDGWTLGRLRNLLAERGVNGLAAAVIQEKPGSPLFIDPVKFFAVLRGRPALKRRRRR